MDEELFFEAIIASERVARWLGDLREATRLSATAATAATAAADDATATATTTATAAAARAIAAAAKAAQALARAVAAENMCGGPYSEAAEEQGAPRALTALMSRLCAAGDGDEEDDEDKDGEAEAAPKPTTTATAAATTALAAARRDALAAAGRAMAALSGPMACGGRVVSFGATALRLPPRGRPLRVREGAISDGLGARVWALAHLALRELCAHPGLVRGRSVLEIGAGTGLLGVAAARLGARSVVVSDNEPAVLRILRACAHLNARDVEEARRGGGGDEEGGAKGGGGGGLPSVHSSEAETVGEEDEEGEGEDEEGNEQADAAAAASAATPASWDVAGGALLVRAFDWADSLAALDGEAAAAPLRLLPPPPPATTNADADAATEDLPPALPRTEAFDVVLGSEVMYEPEHAVLVAAALAHRLSPPGSTSIALLACAGRFAGVFETFAENCARRGLRYRAAPVRPTAADYSDGILARHRAAVGAGPGAAGGAAGRAGAAAAAAEGRAAGGGASGDAVAAPAAAAASAAAASAASSRVEYEGGFLLMAVDWGEAASAGRWHGRGDWVEGLVDGSGAPVETVVAAG